MNKKSIVVVIAVILLIAFALIYTLILKKDNEFYVPVIESNSKSTAFRFLESVLGKTYNIEKPTDIVYGFLPYWSLDEVENIDYQVLTDIAYFALYVDGRGNFIKTTEDGTAEPGYFAWSKGKTINVVINQAKKNNVRVALTVAAHDNDDIEKLLSCNICWRNLADNISKELASKGIYDINLDFEYMGIPPYLLETRYTNLVSYLKNELKRRNSQSQVVVSTFADSLQKVRLTNIPQLTNVSDYLFIMAYDFHRPTSDKAGPVAPINGFPDRYDYDLTKMLEDYREVASANKLIMGVPYYGYNWVVESTQPNSKRIPGDDVLGFSISQNYDQIMSSDYRKNIIWDSEAKVPYFTYFNAQGGVNRQVYFENADSLREKYKLAKNEGLAGVGIWALGYDGDRKELWEVLREEFLEEE